MSPENRLHQRGVEDDKPDHTFHGGSLVENISVRLVLGTDYGVDWDILYSGYLRQQTAVNE